MEEIFHENKTDYSGSDHNRCVYMLLAGKLQKFGGISVMGIVMGLFFLISGHFITSFATNILMGIAPILWHGPGSIRTEKNFLPVISCFPMDCSDRCFLFAIPSAWKAEQP